MQKKQQDSYDNANHGMQFCHNEKKHYVYGGEFMFRFLTTAFRTTLNSCILI